MVHDIIETFVLSIVSLKNREITINLTKRDKATVTAKRTCVFIDGLVRINEHEITPGASERRFSPFYVVSLEN